MASPFSSTWFSHLAPADAARFLVLLLAEVAEGHPKSLVRMLGPSGNPSAKRLMAILTRLACLHGVRFNVGIKSGA